MLQQTIAPGLNELMESDHLKVEQEALKQSPLFFPSSTVKPL